MTQKAKKALEQIIFTLLAVLLVLAISLLLYQRAYAGKIYPHISVAGIDLSGKTKSQARFLLDKKIQNIGQKQLILSAGGKEVPTKVTDTGLSYDLDRTIDNAYTVGRSQSFIKQLWFSAKTIFKKSQINAATVIDQEKFKAFMDANVPNLNIEAKNAEVKIENGVASEVAEQDGQSVDTADLSNKILTLVNENDTAESYRIALTTTPIKPQIKIGDLDNAKAYAEDILKKHITLTYESQSFTPSRADIGNWLYFSVENGAYKGSLNDTAIQAYLNRIAKNFEIQKVDKKINAANGETIEDGRNGRYLEKNKALASIKAQIAISDSFTIALLTYDEPAGEVKIFPEEGVVPGRFDGKYIDIYLAQQKLCAIEGMNIIGCYSISSGKSSTPTPKGLRAIQDKSPMAWSAPYGLYMPWWNGIGGGMGIHELPEWPGGYKEGEAHLGTPVSHGCIRLGVGPAEFIYNWAPIGTPVYIH